MDIFLRYAACSDNFANRFPTRAYDARMLFILSGEGEMRFGERREPFAANTLVYYPPGTVYQPVASPTAPPYFVTLNFDFHRRCADRTQVLMPVAAEAFSQELAVNSHLESGYALFEAPFVRHNLSGLREYFSDIVMENARMTAAAHEAAAALLHYVCCRLAAADPHDAGGKNSELYRQILDYIDRHSVTLQNNAEIAAALNYHPYYINWVFRQESGKTLHRYIVELRLHQAAMLLRGTTQSIAAVSAAVGFRSPEHFSKCFAAQFGVSPRRFRSETPLI